MCSKVCVFQESFNYIYDDQDIDLMKITIEQIEILKRNKTIPKIKGYVKHLIPLLNSVQFQSHFRYVLSLIIKHYFIYIYIYIYIYTGFSKSPETVKYLENKAF